MEIDRLPVLNTLRENWPLSYSSPPSGTSGASTQRARGAAESATRGRIHESARCVTIKDYRGVRQAVKILFSTACSEYSVSRITTQGSRREIVGWAKNLRVECSIWRGPAPAIAEAGPQVLIADYFTISPAKSPCSRHCASRSKKASAPFG